MPEGPDNFTSTEAFIVIGELYVEHRRLQSRHEIVVEQLREAQQKLKSTEQKEADNA